jgi:hypothetical protein
MIRRDQLTKAELIASLKTGRFVFGGNRSSNLAGRVYGSLERQLVNGVKVPVCAGGRRLRASGDFPKSNQVFFESEEDALENGFRPCLCLSDLFRSWTASDDKVAWVEARKKQLHEERSSQPVMTDDPKASPVPWLLLSTADVDAFEVSYKGDSAVQSFRLVGTARFENLDAAMFGPNGASAALEDISRSS